MCLVNTCCDTFSVFADIGGFGLHWLMYILWSTHVEIHVESTLAFERFGEHMLSYILCPRWYGRGLVNKNCVAFSDLAGIGGIWSTKDAIHFMFSLAWERFGQHFLKYVFCPRINEIVLVNTS
jgi:hypothetical protein